MSSPSTGAAAATAVADAPVEGAQVDAVPDTTAPARALDGEAGSITASGTHSGEPPTADTAGDPPFVLTAAVLNELRDLTRARWAGWLAPLGKRAGDLRPGLPLPTSGTLKTREMPLPFFWQRETTHGGTIMNGAREIGAVTYADIRPNPARNDEPWLWGMGFIDLNDSDGVQYVRRLADRMSRWISVKLDFDPEFEPPAEFLAVRKGETERRVSPTDHPDWWRLMNATAESQPAFDGAEIFLLDDIEDVEDPDDEPGDARDPDEDTDHDCNEQPATEPGESARGPVPQLISSGAEVNAMSTTSTTMQLPPEGAEIKPPETSGPASGGSGQGVSGGNAGDHGRGEALVAVVTGDTSLPIADRDAAWNGPEATKRLIEWAGGRFKLDPAKMAKVFLYRDSAMSPKMVTAYKFPIADVVGGQVKIVPRAVFTAAAVLRGSMGGTKIPKADQGAMKGKISTIYGRMAKQFDDPKIKAPFDAAVVSDAHAAAMREGDKAPKAQPPWRRPVDRKRERRGLPRLAASASSWAASVAQRVPDEPPREWFANPGLTKPSKIRVTDDGRVYGHVAAWHTEHAAFPGVHPPRNRDQTYSKFHRHPVRCAGGDIVKTGPLATGGHTTTDVSLAIETVQAHYDDPRYVVADVIAGEDEHGIWVSGALRPGVSPFQVMLADRYSFSGDWRYGELLAACSVSVPGFHLDADEEVGALTAAAAGAGCEDLPVVAEATPAIVADASGAPAVLIAAGVVLDDEGRTEDHNAEFHDAIDALGSWLQQELAALRNEFGMSETTTKPTTDQVVAIFQEMVGEQLRGLRTELGLPDAPAAENTADGAAEPGGTGGEPAAADAAAPTEAGAAEPAADVAPQPATDTAAPAAPAEPAPAADPAAAPADTTTAAASATPEVAAFQQWLDEQFGALRAEHAATSTAAAQPTGQTADFAAERQALLADIHGDTTGDERSQLLAFVHEGA